MTMDITALTHARVLVIGDVMLDKYLWGDVQRISPEAPVPVVRIKDTSVTLGGAGNVAANITGLGARATVVGLIGTDPTGECLESLFKEKRVRTLLTREALRPTITKTRIMGQGQQLLRLDEETSGPLIPSAEADLMAHVDTALADCQVVILSDYGKGIFQTPGLSQRIITRCQTRGIPVLVDPKGGQWDRYTGATCITPNTAELSQVTVEAVGHDDASLVGEARKLCRQFRIDWLLVTRGPRGMCLVDGGETTEFIQANAREVYDVSGAGDTVVATLAACLACGVTIHSAAETANLAAGIVVGKLGTQPIDQNALATAVRLMESGSQGAHSSKVVTVEAARVQVKAWRSAGESVVFTNGCFDLLHPGHITLLHQARALGNRLVIGLNTDASVRRLKGETRPILPEQDRAAILSALASVDLVVLFDEDTPLSLIGALTPDILVKGADYRIDEVVGRDIVEAAGGKVCLVPILKGHSTTEISRKITTGSQTNSSIVKKP